MPSLHSNVRQRLETIGLATWAGPISPPNLRFSVLGSEGARRGLVARAGLVPAPPSSSVQAAGREEAVLGASQAGTLQNRKQRTAADSLGGGGEEEEGGL